jgi:hypothetical protein
MSADTVVQYLLSAVIFVAFGWSLVAISVGILEGRRGVDAVLWFPVWILGLYQPRYVTDSGYEIVIRHKPDYSYTWQWWIREEGSNDDRFRTPTGERGLATTRRGAIFAADRTIKYKISTLIPSGAEVIR